MRIVDATQTGKSASVKWDTCNAYICFQVNCMYTESIDFTRIVAEYTSQLNAANTQHKRYAHIVARRG